MLLIAILSFVSVQIIAQNTDEAALKNVIQMEHESLLKRDTTTFKSLYLHDEKMTREYVNSGGMYKIEGWSAFAHQVTQWATQNPSPGKYTEVKDDNYIVRMSDKLATIEYDEKVSAPGIDSLKPYYSHEFRTMVKEDNKWKIAAFTTIDSLSFTSGDSAYIEDNLNGTGYRLLNAKKIKDAIEVFKVNVKLFPHSWNVYDSLGEAFADDGNTDDAIKNYEMSVKINPKSDSGKQALEKLKKKK